MEIKELLESVIPIGKKNAIHQEELAKRLGVTTASAKYLVKKARQQGLPILSSTLGYWWSDNVEDTRAFITAMQKQAKSRFKSVSAINDSLVLINANLSHSDNSEEVVKSE